MRSLVVAALLLVLFSSCLTKSIDPNSFEGKLVTTINSTCGDFSNCTIRLKDVTEFDWDRVFVFNYAVTQEEIEKLVGNPFPRYQEFERSMIFLNGGKIVYSESDPTDIESLINNQVVFDTDERGNYKSYSSESRFEVKRKQFRGGVYYELTLKTNAE